MIRKFDEKYGCPRIINTSFNVRGEPMVCTPGSTPTWLHADQTWIISCSAISPEKKTRKPPTRTLTG